MRLIDNIPISYICLLCVLSSRFLSFSLAWLVLMNRTGRGERPLYGLGRGAQVWVDRQDPGEAAVVNRQHHVPKKYTIKY